MREIDPPSGAFLKELERVRDASLSMEMAISNANLLPRDFPMRQAEALCVTLQSLSNGTAKGAVLSLDYASLILPDWRTDYFAIDYEATSHASDLNVPKPDRDGHFGSSLKNLASAVSDALSIYRRQTNTEALTPPKSSEYLQKDKSTDSSKEDVYIKASTAIEKSNYIKDQLDKSNIDISVVDSVMRSSTDVKNQASNAQIEVSLSTTRLSYLERISEGLSWTGQRILVLCKHAPQLIEPSAELSSKWAKKAITELGELTRDVAVAIDRTIVIGRKAINEKSALNQDAEPFDAEKHDDELHEIILRGHSPPRSWWKEIEVLSFYWPKHRRKLDDISALNNFKNLRQLDLHSTNVSDLSPIKDLKNLQWIDCRSTKVSDNKIHDGILEKIKKIYVDHKK